MEHGNLNQGTSGYGYWPEPARNPDYEKTAFKKVRQCFSRIGLIYVFFLMVSILSQWAVAVSLSELVASGKLSQNWYLFLSMFSMYPLAVPLTGLLMKLVPSQGHVGQEKWGFGKLCGFFVFSMGVLYVGNLIGITLMTLAGTVKGEPIVNDVQELILSMDPWMVLIVAVLIAPIMEELVFRKFLLDRIAGFGHWTAMAVSGIVFGIVHGNFYQFFYAFGLGMVFAYVYLHTGKIMYTIGFHMLINFCGSILPMGLLKVLEIQAFLGGLLAVCNVMVMIGFIISSLILLFCCWRDLFFQPGMDMLPTGKKIMAVWGNLGMIMFLCCGIGLFLFSI